MRHYDITSKAKIYNQAAKLCRINNKLYTKIIKVSNAKMKKKRRTK